MTASIIAVWHGPFSEPELHLPVEVPCTGHLKLAQSTPSTVILSTTASQMAAGDTSWWSFH